MKQRFISFLLSAVMLLTMLPVTAFAAISTKGSVAGVYFYADPEKANEKYNEILNLSADDAKDDCERDTMLIRLKDLAENGKYRLTITYPEGTEFGKDVDEDDFLQIENDEGYSLLVDEWTAKQSGPDVRTVTLKHWADRLDKSYDGLCEGTYRVRLWQYTGAQEANEVWTKYYNLRGTYKEIELEETTLKFGPDADPIKIIKEEERKDNKHFYEISDTNASLFVDANELPTAGGILKDTSVLEKWITFDDDRYTYSKGDTLQDGSWDYSEKTRTFAWGAQLTRQSNIIPAPLYSGTDEMVHYTSDEYNAEVREQLKPSTTTSELNVVYVDAKDLMQHNPYDSSTKGYWAGFAVIAPEAATKVKYKSATTAEGLNTAKFKERDVQVDIDGEGNKGMTFYVNMEDEITDRELYHSVEFVTSKGTAVTSCYKFRVDVSKVVLNTTEKRSVKMTGNRVSTVIEEHVITTLLNANDKNKINGKADNVITIDLSATKSNSSVVEADVTFTADAVKKLIEKTNVDDNIKLSFKTPVGSVKIPVADLQNLNTKEDATLVVKRHDSRDFANTMFEETVVGNQINYDLLDINIYEEETPNTPVLITSSDFDNDPIEVSIVLKNVKSEYDSAAEKEKVLDTVYFYELNNPMWTQEAVINQRRVPFVSEETDDEVLFNVSHLSAYQYNGRLYDGTYGVALRRVVNKTHTTDPLASIKVLEGSSGTTNLLTDFDPLELTYNITTTASSVRFNLSDRARILDNGDEKELYSDDKEYELKRTDNVFQVKIGTRVYHITITKVLGETKQLTLHHDLNVINGIDKITVKDPIEGRLYYAQTNKVKWIEKPTASNPNGKFSTKEMTLSVCKKTADNEVAFYIPAYDSKDSNYAMFFSIWEISDGADEPLTDGFGTEKPDVISDRNKDRQNIKVLVDTDSVKAYMREQTP